MNKNALCTYERQAPEEQVEECDYGVFDQPAAG